MAGKLSAKQKRFVEEYLIDLNAAAAYRRAGYVAKTDHVASVNASALMANHGIAEAIVAAQQERANRTETSQDWVLERLKKEALLEGEGSSHSARISAVKLIGQHLGMFSDKLELSGKVDHQHSLSEAEREAGIKAIVSRYANPASGAGLPLAAGGESADGS